MKYVVYNIQSCRYTTFETQTAAKRNCTVQNKKVNRIAAKRAAYWKEAAPAPVTEFAYTDWDNFNTNINVVVQTYNMLDPLHRPIPIRRSEQGGCCDPATETYHSM